MINYLPGLSPKRDPRKVIDYAEPFARALATRPNLPSAEREALFAPGRRWRFDFLWPARIIRAHGHFVTVPALALEIDGGVYVAAGGRHNTDRDREKLAIAAALGYRVIRLSAAMCGIKTSCGVAQIVHPERMSWCLDLIGAALAGREFTAPCPAVELEKARTKAKSLTARTAANIKKMRGG